MIVFVIKYCKMVHCMMRVVICDVGLAAAEVLRYACGSVKLWPAVAVRNL